ncbi:hypothetical protein Poly51_31260 [Rubripirellula tenax]|uniref:Uncharacterized protein n=1 Tax=Rubripirellula tenax TaxID=2528015 RepID=A0A5C6F204_9BACT|nr:hypothetical protein [Rubripirellula tenax]TWU54407.1 hypothetical protein Poly51_31260 [Rubripirellula tenax]
MGYGIRWEVGKKIGFEANDNQENYEKQKEVGQGNDGREKIGWREKEADQEGKDDHESCCEGQSKSDEQGCEGQNR